MHSSGMCAESSRIEWSGFVAAGDSNRRENPKDRSGSTGISNTVLLQVFAILAHVLKIHQSNLSTDFQDAHNFGDGLAASVSTGNVVDCKIGHNSIHGGVGEGQLSHVSISHFHSFGHPFPRRILYGCFARVVSLIDLRPEIDPDAATARNSFRGGDQQ